MPDADTSMKPLIFFVLHSYRDKDILLSCSKSKN